MLLWSRGFPLQTTDLMTVSATDSAQGSVQTLLQSFDRGTGGGGWCPLSSANKQLQPQLPGLQPQRPFFQDQLMELETWHSDTV